MRPASKAGDPERTLPGGVDGNDGWFAITSAPPSWASDLASNDGLENFLLAGPGLGSPDEDGNRVSLLGNVPNVIPVRAAGLSQLVGRTVCAVVFDGDIVVSAATPSAANLDGVNLGVVAFQVTSVDPAGGDWPGVTIQILDARATCHGAVTAFVEAPPTQ